MKCLLVSALLLFGSTTWAQALPKGNVNITIMRSEVDKETFEWKFTEICHESIPFETRDARENKPGLILHSDKCTFVENGVKYRVAAYYGSLLTNVPVRLGTPKTDLLNFLGDIVVMSDSGLDPVPFPNILAQSFSTKDMAIKNAILNVYANQSVSCPNAPVEPTPNPPTGNKTSSQYDNCTVNNPVAIQAVIEYEVH